MSEPAFMNLLLSTYCQVRAPFVSFQQPVFELAHHSTCSELWKVPCVEGDVGLVLAILSKVYDRAVSRLLLLRSLVSS